MNKKRTELDAAKLSKEQEKSSVLFRGVFLSRFLQHASYLFGGHSYSFAGHELSEEEEDVLLKKVTQKSLADFYSMYSMISQDEKSQLHSPWGVSPKDLPTLDKMAEAEAAKLEPEAELQCTLPTLYGTGIAEGRRPWTKWNNRVKYEKGAMRFARSMATPIWKDAERAIFSSMATATALPALPLFPAIAAKSAFSGKEESAGPINRIMDNFVHEEKDTGHLYSGGTGRTAVLACALSIPLAPYLATASVAGLATAASGANVPIGAAMLGTSALSVSSKSALSSKRKYKISDEIKNSKISDFDNNQAQFCDISTIDKATIAGQNGKKPNALRGFFSNTTIKKIKGAGLEYAKDVQSLAVGLEDWAEKLPKEEKNKTFSKTFVVGGLNNKLQGHSYPLHVIYSDGFFHAFAFDSVGRYDPVLKTVLGTTFATISCNGSSFQHTKLGCREYSIEVGKELKADTAYQAQLLNAAKLRLSNPEYRKETADSVVELMGLGVIGLSAIPKSKQRVVGDIFLKWAASSKGIGEIDVYSPRLTRLMGDYKTLKNQLIKHQDNTSAVNIIKDQIAKAQKEGSFEKYNRVLPNKTISAKDMSPESAISAILKDNKKLQFGGFTKRFLDTAKKSIVSSDKVRSY